MWGVRESVTSASGAFEPWRFKGLAFRFYVGFKVLVGITYQQFGVAGWRRKTPSPWDNHI